MNSDRLSAILAEARRLPGPQREAYLAGLAAVDEPLARRAREMLREAAPQTASALSNADTAVVARVAAELSEAREPDQIGPYRIIERLGRGGMGVVYKAEQRTPIQRIVAVKVIRSGMDTREVLARFEAERQVLAQLDHPHIAKVLEAGTSQTGQPYFVMEYVPGEPITRFADANRLTVRQRLELFKQVCEAIGHAHTKAIIHRDITARNVLAFMRDNRPKVKVIDFGIAKALSPQRLTDITMHTGIGRVVGTYEYMSPEQAAGSPDIDTRTDIFSLGVLLYELLVGARPLDESTLAEAADEEIRRLIREEPAPHPSTRLLALGATATRSATARQSQVHALARELRRELEWIPLKALRKERDRRYQSASEIIADIDNYLAGRPLVAGPESRVYRARKFVRRHRLILLGAGAALGIGVAATGFYVRSIRLERDLTRAARDDEARQRQRAQRRLVDVQKLANQLIVDFQPRIAPLPGATPVVADMVKTARDYLETLVADAPESTDIAQDVARAYLSLGNVQAHPGVPGNLGDSAGAIESYRRAVEILERIAAGEPANLTRVRNALIARQSMADMQALRGDTAAAEQTYRQIVDRLSTLADAHPKFPQLQFDCCVAQTKLADMLEARGHRQAALELHTRSLQTRERLAQQFADNDSARAALALGCERVGDALLDTGNINEALRMHTRALAIRQELSNKRPDDLALRQALLTSYERMTEILARQGGTEQAVSLGQSAIAMLLPLAEQDANNTRLWALLASLHERTGDARVRMHGRPRDGTDNFRAALSIRQRLANRDPTNTESQRAMGLAEWRVAEALLDAETPGRPATADDRAAIQAHLQRALDTLSALQARGQLSDHDKTAIATIQARLAEIDKGGGR